MKNNFKLFAAIMVLTIAAVFASQREVLLVHAAEDMKPAADVRFGSDYNVYFSNPNAENAPVSFKGTLICPGGNRIEYSGYAPTENGGLFFTFENLKESGTYQFKIDTLDMSAGRKVIDTQTVSVEYIRPDNQLSDPEDLAWSKDGILTFKAVEGARQYSFDVCDSNGNSVIGMFGSNILGTFMKNREDGYIKIALNKFIAFQYGVSIENGYSVKVRASSTDIDSIASGNWKSVTYNSGSTDSNNESEAVPAPMSCNHEYEWVTERNATTITNAEDIYQCKYCGDVKERMEVANSAYAKFNKDAIEAIDKAPLNGTVVIKTDMWVSFYASVIDMLKSRPDVTVNLNYFYKGTRYTMTIPAGADLSVLVEADGFYGFRYLDIFFPGQEVK